MVWSIMVLSVTMYITDTVNVQNMIGTMGFTAWLLHHVAFAKSSSIVFLLYRKYHNPTEWAYDG